MDHSITHISSSLFKLKPMSAPQTWTFGLQDAFYKLYVSDLPFLGNTELVRRPRLQGIYAASPACLRFWPGMPPSREYDRGRLSQVTGVIIGVSFCIWPQSGVYIYTKSLFLALFEKLKIKPYYCGTSCPHPTSSSL